MGRAAVIWPESCLSHREGANVSDFKNVSRCSKVKVKIECLARASARLRLAASAAISRIGSRSTLSCASTQLKPPTGAWVAAPPGPKGHLSGHAQVHQLPGPQCSGGQSGPPWPPPSAPLSGGGTHSRTGQCYGLVPDQLGPRAVQENTVPCLQNPTCGAIQHISRQIAFNSVKLVLPAGHHLG